MNVKTGLTSVFMLMLLAFFTHPVVAAVTLAVQDPSVQAGTSDVPVPITVSSDALLAGASFTISYSEELTFVGISSTYFDTFLAQGFDAGDLPPCDLDGDGVLDEGECDTDGDGVPETGEFFEQPLIVSTDDTVTDGKKELMIAAARVDVPTTPVTDGTSIILTLIFDTPFITGTAVYEVDVKKSEILNESAGYATLTDIPLLVAFDDSQPVTADQYPEIDVTNVPYPEALDGTLTVTDGDTDDDNIPDQWELLYVPSGTADPLAYFGSGDKDGDGYSDYQEYLNRNELDPLDAAYDPNVKNAAGGTGYDKTNTSNVLPAIYKLLLLNN